MPTSSKAGGANFPLAVARQSIVSKTLGDALAASIVYGAPLEPTLARAQLSINHMLARDALFVAFPTR